MRHLFFTFSSIQVQDSAECTSPYGPQKIRLVPASDSKERNPRQDLVRSRFMKPFHLFEYASLAPRCL